MRHDAISTDAADLRPDGGAVSWPWVPGASGRAAGTSGGPDSPGAPSARAAPGSGLDGSATPAPRPGALTPPAVSLPTGGGAIRGIGEKFAANPVTGAASLTVPLALPEGRAGFGPELTLGYDSTAGNGPFGFGWQLSLPAVTRRTDKGIPRYSDDDVVIISGAEDLVAVPGPDDLRLGYAVRRYRPRIEGPLTRIERWTRLHDGDTHWRTITRDNVLAVYGIDVNSRIADPGDASRVFSWLICAKYDDRGNAVAYDYVAEDDSGVDGTAAHECNRSRQPGSRSANRYLKRVRYGNRTPLLCDPAVAGFRPAHLPTPDLGSAGWMFEVVLDYGEGHYRSQPPDADGRILVAADPVAPPGSAWPVRSDPFSRYRPGFEVRTYRLCRAVLVFHHFAAELGASGYLARATRFRYDEKPYGSFLKEVASSGYARQPGGLFLERSLPPLSCDYSTTPLDSTGDLDFEVSDLAGVENVPAGVDGVAFRWVDLNGEGIPGVLAEQSGTLLYKPNLGSGRLGPLASLRSVPAAVEASTARVRTRQLVDLAGDGSLDYVEFGPDGAGFYERTDDGWASFRPFESWPRLSWLDGTARLADLTGDGLADILVAGDGCLTWFGSLGENGFAPAVRVPLPADEERGPRLVFAGDTWSIHLADLSGDGLADVVRIRNGDVCYWPNLGYGRFGAKVTMDKAPHFDRPDRFDPRRIRLADTDGSGTTDIVYLCADAVHIYLNEAGNTWSDARLVRTPPVGPPATLAVVDLLGRGTSCLVWSSPLPTHARRPARYLDLMAGRKPHLLTRVRNGLGAEITIEYASSTEFYLADKEAGQPWATRLPFPVHVVRRVETYDHIGRNRYVSRYSYHHGYFDATDREWRGFGRVDQLDTEELAALTALGDGSDSTASNVDELSHVPPVETRSWYHTGAYLPGGEISRHLASEYYREPRPDSVLLEDTVLPPGLTPSESAEACRALKGLLLRREVYARDGSEGADRPYTVSEHSYTLRPLQPRVFLPHPRETVELHYERRLYPVGDGLRADPRVNHTLTLDVDDFGNVLLSASVAYGRRFPDSDPRLAATDRAAQARTSVTCAVRQVTDPVSGADAWRTPLPYQTATYELYHVVPAGRLFGFDELHALVGAAGDGAHDLPYEDLDGTGALGGGPFRRVLEGEQVRYRRNDLSGPLGPGQLESLALPHASYRLAMTAGLASAVYGSKLNPAELASALSEGGQVQLSGSADWWSPSNRVFYSPDPDDPPSAELAEASQHFFRERRWVDPFGNATTVDYDPHDLFVAETRDVLDNVVGYVHNYRVLKPTSAADANRNRRAVAFDALGMVVGIVVMGKPEENLGDSLAGFATDLTDAVVAGHLADPRSGPLALLGRAGTRLTYDLHAFSRTGTKPVTVSTLTRVTHDADPGGATTSVHCQLSYLDGFGQELQQKREAEDGRWITTGWTVCNNKGRPVRQYEPFFDTTHEFVHGHTAGVSPILCYDPLGRVVAVVYPNHAWRKAVFDPWRQDTWDVNDTVLVADPATDPDVGGHLGRLPAAHYLPTWYAARSAGALGAAEQDAAVKAADHAGTPALAAVDPLGRTILVVAHNRTGGVDTLHRTRLILDVQGNRRAVVDGRDRLAARSVVDVAGNEILSSSIDAGERRLLCDINREPIRRWDARGHVFGIGYDPLRRVISRTVRGTDPARSDPRTLAGPVLYERISYGEGQPHDVEHNLRTRMVAGYDGAGVDAIDQYDFKGNPLHHTRRCPVDHRALPDWSGDPLLEPETWHNWSTFDALNRPVTLSTPDGSVTRLSYTARGLLAAVDVRLRGADPPTTFVAAIRYNARGQETAVDLGSGARIHYEYDPMTFRPVRVTTTRPSAGDALASQLFQDAARVQDLHYCHDPSGNVTQLADSALRTVFHDNAQVEPVSRYTYDACYRLVQAVGREHVGQSATSMQPAGGNYRDFPFAGAAQLTDLTAVRSYTERYSYDEVGNITSMAHAAGGAGWTRSYTYQEPSLLEPSRVGNRLSRTATPDGGTEPYGYDDHGSLTQAPHLPVLEWDFKGQLQAASRQVVNGTTARETTYYTYSAGGQRVRKVTERPNGTRRNGRLYLRGSELFRDFAGDGHTVALARETLHVMAAARRVALVETKTVDSGQPVSGPALAPHARYQFGNHLDSAALELDGTGGLISYEEYSPYGATVYQAGRTAAEVSLKRFRYTGRERDEETGFGYHGARYYAPWLGRWTACDPAGLVDGPNLYQYAHSNPCRMRDPSGTQAEDEERPRAPDRPPAPTRAPDRPPAHGQGDGGRPADQPGGPDPPAAPPGGQRSRAPDAREPGGAQAAQHAERSGDGGANAPAASPTPPGRTPGGAAAAGPRRYTSTPPADRHTHLEIGRGFREVTKLHYRHWPGTEYDQRTGKPKSGPTWLSWLSVIVFLGVVGVLVGFAGRNKSNDPQWYQVLKYGTTGLLAALVATRLIMEATVSKTPEGETPKQDKWLADPWWTTIHTMTGVVMGLWQVPFPIVAGATVVWEIFEISVPGFGDHEINGNRAIDIGVAWVGWAVAAGFSSWQTKAPFPHGFSGDHYTRDRLY